MDVNKEWAKGKSKDVFIKALEKSDLGVDLGQLWESLQPPKKEVEKPKTK